MANSYGETILLPKTTFSMRGNLPDLETRLLDRWQRIGLWGELRVRSEGREKFILHDGPPYANGSLHMGHVLNKVLKDVINKSRQMMGYDVNYVPGWDCHGLPIEWQIEERFRSEGRSREEIDIIEFRKACRDSACYWMGVQSEGFRRLGVFGDWDNPYITMSKESESITAEELGKFLLSGSMYRGVRPVQWSVPEQTTLSDAETEYHEIVSSAIFVGFEIIDGDFVGDEIIIWTTTPWTIPSNQAIACKDDIDYVRVLVKSVEEGSLVDEGRLFWVASNLKDELIAKIRVSDFEILQEVKGSDLVGLECKHPLSASGYDRVIPVLSGEFVSDDQGTGFVHMAPDHGEDDFYLCRDHGLHPLEQVSLEGKFKDFVPLFSGKVIWDENGKSGDANSSVIVALEGVGKLYASGRLRHQYPHSWRSKCPLMTLVTSQWFISMEENGLRRKSLSAIEGVDFYPPDGKKRLYTMIRDRPDWCISRQRSWGVPLPIFVEKSTGEPLLDSEVLGRIVAIFKEDGSDAWFVRDNEDFLGDDYESGDYEKVMDVADVWFDSGSTHRFVLDSRSDLSFPADMYLEGTDQHRGWFHSSLLESCGTKGVAPYKSILTHGFVLDGKGRKMSKSVGNVLDPYKVMKKLGAEIMRLWVVESRYYDDMRSDMDAMTKTVDLYRRFRNTLRWILGNFKHQSNSPQVFVRENFSNLDLYILHRLCSLSEYVEDCCNQHEYQKIYRKLHEFCTVDLSSLYFDVSKDTLYCSAIDSVERESSMYVLRAVFDHLVRWLAPVLSFTTEEAYLCDKFIDFESSDIFSVHLEDFLEPCSDWRDNELEQEFEKLLSVRRVVLGALEIARAEGKIGSSLQACPYIYVARDFIDDVEKAELDKLCITSAVRLLPLRDAPDGVFTIDGEDRVSVEIKLADGQKCERCWMVLPEVGELEIKDVCSRCQSVIQKNNYALGE